MRRSKLAATSSATPGARPQGSRRQAQLWDPTAFALFDRIKVRRGWRVLEVGPGKGSLHMELRRRVKGPIDAVERSQVFADLLRTRCRRDGFGQGAIWETDLIAARLPARDMRPHLRAMGVSVPAGS